MDRADPPSDLALRIVGAIPVGLTEANALEINRRVQQEYEKLGRAVAVRAMRYIPSSRTTTENGATQFVATAMLEIPVDDSTPYAETVDSVITFRGSGAVQTIESVSIPALPGTR